jgi:ferredoxin
MCDTLEHHRVHIEETGESFVCGESETALNALARSGRRGIPLGCRGGGCGVCKVLVLQGDFSKRPMSRSHVSEQDEASNQVLACCIVPRTDLQLRVIGKMQRVLTRPR